MKKIILSTVALSGILLSSLGAHAGINLASVCSAGKGTVYKDITVDQIYAIPHDKDRYANTSVKLGNFTSQTQSFQFAIFRNAVEVFELAKIAYLTQSKVDVCLRSVGSVEGSDELFSIELK